MSKENKNKNRLESFKDISFKNLRKQITRQLQKMHAPPPKKIGNIYKNPKRIWQPHISKYPKTANKKCQDSTKFCKFFDSVYLEVLNTAIKVPISRDPSKCRWAVFTYKSMKKITNKMSRTKTEN